MHWRINNSNACGQLRVHINIVRPWGRQIQPRVSLFRNCTSPINRLQHYSKVFTILSSSAVIRAVNGTSRDLLWCSTRGWSCASWADSGSCGRWWTPAPASCSLTPAPRRARLRTQVAFATSCLKGHHILKIQIFFGDPSYRSKEVII